MSANFALSARDPLLLGSGGNGDRALVPPFQILHRQFRVGGPIFGAGVHVAVGLHQHHGHVHIAQHELGRLTLLTDKVLNTSLFDETGVIIDRESIDLEKIISDIMNSMKLVFEKQKAMVEFEKVGSNFSMKASAVHITNVIYNLLDNALKYSPSNPTILIKLSDLGEKISLTVSDHGLGIPKEFHKKIFEKFFRMPTGDVHNIKGYGLGLSYVEGVVKAHGGSIEVMSEVGKGSTFIIQFPK